MFKPSIACLSLFLAAAQISVIRPLLSLRQSEMSRIGKATKHIESVSVELVQGSSPVIKKPYFSCEDPAREFYFYLGDIVDELLGLDRDDPYLLVYRKQIQLEALKALIMGRAGASSGKGKEAERGKGRNAQGPTNFCQNYLQRISKEPFWSSFNALTSKSIRSAVKDIETTPDRAILQKKIESHQASFDKLASDLEGAIRLFAKKNGYQAIASGTQSGGVRKFTVKVVRNPSGGKIEVLPYFRYLHCKILNGCEGIWPWRELIGETEQLIGQYYYRAEWPKAGSSEGVILINSDTSITFAPHADSKPK